ncbi:hypothetical protein FGO68_gene16124 [Halteria grandinella]|uniref:Uncharacterized protein n=1 Tax=Halteria grandinella TaxID=5974 RepID=A0A8J8NKW0_HALGN|nr:hypothetical protein FGO68_gene16124 [Halteria grandinella]
MYVRNLSKIYYQIQMSQEQEDQNQHTVTEDQEESITLSAANNILSPLKRETEFPALNASNEFTFREQPVIKDDDLPPVQQRVKQEPKKSKRNSQSSQDDEDSVFDSSSHSHSQDSRKSSENEDNPQQHRDGFIVKNGCCKDCMKAFSRNGKSCLCQVPRLQRRSSLPPHGCKYCSCHGCNPIDIRKDKRRELKEKLKNEGRLSKKQQRILDSDDEDMKLDTKFDEWHKNKQDLGRTIAELLAQIAQSQQILDPSMIGFGFPQRHASYILGCSRKWISEDEYNRRKPKFT